MADGPAADPGSHQPVAGDEPLAADHDERHELAIAALLDPDLARRRERHRRRLAETCAACAALHADLVCAGGGDRGDCRHRRGRATSG